MISEGGKQKNRRDSLYNIKAAVLLLKNNMSSHLIGEALYAQMEYDRLTAQYYDEYKVLCSPDDYEAARQDVDYFIGLLDAAIEANGNRP